MLVLNFALESEVCSAVVMGSRKHRRPCGARVQRCKQGYDPPHQLFLTFYLLLKFPNFFHLFLVLTT